MAISLTADGLNLDYRTELIGSAPEGTYPIGTVIGLGMYANPGSIPGTWVQFNSKSAATVGGFPTNVGTILAIRVA